MQSHLKIWRHLVIITCLLVCVQSHVYLHTMLDTLLLAAFLIATTLNCKIRCNHAHPGYYSCEMRGLTRHLHQPTVNNELVTTVRKLLSIIIIHSPARSNTK